MSHTNQGHCSYGVPGRNVVPSYGVLRRGIGSSGLGRKPESSAKIPILYYPESRRRGCFTGSRHSSWHGFRIKLMHNAPCLYDLHESKKIYCLTLCPPVKNHRNLHADKPSVSSFDTRQDLSFKRACNLIHPLRIHPVQRYIYSLRPVWAAYVLTFRKYV